MSGFVQSWSSRAATAFDLRPASTVASLVITICAPLVFLTVWASGSNAHDVRVAGMLGAIAVVSVALTAAAIVATAARALPEERRRSWTLTVVGLLAYAAGAALWFDTLRGADAPPTTGAGDVAYLVAMVAFAVATLRHPLMRPRSRLVRTSIDAAIVAASLTALLWFVAGRHLFADTGDWAGTTISLVFPALDVFVLLLCCTAMARPRIEPRAVTSSLLLSIGFASFAVGDLAQLLVRTYDPGLGFPLVVETAWICAFVMLAAAGRAALGRSKAIRLPVPRQAIATGLAVAPTAFAVVATITTVVDAAHRGRVDSTAMLLLMTVVALALVRQSLTVADNGRLGASLQSAVGELERQATHDSLTDLPNRAGLTDRITAALERHDDGQSLVALLFLDLDHLKAVNDSLGHAAGDELLQSVAVRLGARVGSTVTRFGGDEFVVLLDGASSPTAVERIGRSIVDDASHPLQLRGFQIRPSVSVGIALSEPGLTAEEMLRRADVGLYRAKSLGRRCVATYGPELDVGSRRLVDLEPELRRAIARDEFEVHYQPVVRLRTGEVVGVESLLRWRHPLRGLLLPGEFLQEATANGMLGELGRRTLLTACADFGPDGAAAGRVGRVAVNLSTSELSSDQVVRRVEDALAHSGMDPQRLTVEITEDVILDDTIRRTIDRLRTLGVDLSIDDFGTGNSSLRQLGAYPASTLKVDRSFVERLEEDGDALMVTRAILGLARNLGLRTVAEGVETDGQARILADLGCDDAQGWLFSRAMPLADLLVHLDEGPPSLDYLRERPPAPSSSVSPGGSVSSGGAASPAGSVSSRVG